MWPSVLSLSLLVALPVAPCLWDTDTLDDELRGLPEARALMTGRWYRHGPAYYRARLLRLPAQIKARPADLAAYDDLAVAHEKLGDHAAAIAVMASKAEVLSGKKDAEHRYRLHANLGTFLAHSGDLDRALVELDKALVINPEAHFGREIWQKHLIGYIKAARANPQLWSEKSSVAYAMDRDEFEGLPLGDDEFRELETAYVGMLRFGGREGAELYRSLGSIYHGHRDYHLAWWAYHRAVDGGHPALGVIQKQLHAIENHWRQAGMPEVPRAADFVAVRDNGVAWLKAFQAAESAALDAGEDPGSSEVLARLLAETNREVPELATPAKAWFWRLRGQPDAFGTVSLAMLSLVVSALAVLALALAIVRRWRARAA